MIKVNLLSGPTARPVRVWVPPEQRGALLGLALLALTAAGVGGWWWQIGRQHDAVDADITEAQAELTRLRDVALLVDEANQRRSELADRVTLIERLRATQRGPVSLLEAVSRGIPEGLWLMELRQQGAAVQLEGRAVSLTAVTDFVEHLQTSGHFLRPVDILTTSMETVGEASVVRFAVRGQSVLAPPTVEAPR